MALVVVQPVRRNLHVATRAPGHASLPLGKKFNSSVAVASAEADK